MVVSRRRDEADEMGSRPVSVGVAGRRVMKRVAETEERGRRRALARREESARSALGEEGVVVGRRRR